MKERVQEGSQERTETQTYQAQNAIDKCDTQHTFIERRVELPKQVGKISQKYSNIPVEIRQKFINRVTRQEATVRQAAQEFGIKFSTSKAILQTYKKHGRIGQKPTRDRSMKNSFFSRESSQFKQGSFSPATSCHYSISTKQNSFDLPTSRSTASTTNVDNFPFITNRSSPELKPKSVLEVELEQNINSLFNIDFPSIISKAEQNFAYLLLGTVLSNHALPAAPIQVPALRMHKSSESGIPIQLTSSNGSGLISENHFQ